MGGGERVGGVGGEGGGVGGYCDFSCLSLAEP